MVDDGGPDIHAEPCGHHEVEGARKVYRRNNETVEPDVAASDETDDPTTEFIVAPPNTEQRKRSIRKCVRQGMVRTSICLAEQLGRWY